jgi:DnaK suppressor protein
VSLPGEDELTEAQLESLRDLLHQKRDEVQQGLAASREDARPVGLDLSIGRLTRVDALQQQHMAAARRGRLETQLAQIQQALSKLLAGTYGECVRCGEPIAYARLKVRPESPFCIRCQGGAAP